MIEIEKVREGLTGPVTSLSPIFHRDGSINYKSVCHCIDFYIEEARSGTVLLTNGDSLFSILTDEEVGELTKVAVEYTQGRAMVVAAAKPWWLKKTKEFAGFARDMGVDVLMVLPPDWAKSCTVETIVEYCSEISEEIPLMLVTALGSGRGLPLKSLEILLERENIVAVKDDVCGVYGKRMASVVEGRIPIVSGGRKINHLDLMPFGADGYLSPYARFKPSVSQEYWDCISQGNINRAVEIIHEYDVAFFDLAEEQGVDFDAQIHASFELFGIAKRWRRAPYHNFSDKQMSVLKEFFVQKELL